MLETAILTEALWNELVQNAVDTFVGKYNSERDSKEKGTEAAALAIHNLIFATEK
jgi:hypothetical protein